MMINVFVNPLSLYLDVEYCYSIIAGQSFLMIYINEIFAQFQYETKKKFIQMSGNRKSLTFKDLKGLNFVL